MSYTRFYMDNNHRPPRIMSYSGHVAGKVRPPTATPIPDIRDRYPNPNADSPRYAGMARVATKKTRPHSKHATSAYRKHLAYLGKAYDQPSLSRDGYYWHNLGFRKESKPIEPPSITPYHVRRQRHGKAVTIKT